MAPAHCQESHYPKLSHKWASRARHSLQPTLHIHSFEQQSAAKMLNFNLFNKARNTIRRNLTHNSQTLPSNNGLHEEPGHSAVPVSVRFVLFGCKCHWLVSLFCYSKCASSCGSREDNVLLAFDGIFWSWDKVRIDNAYFPISLIFYCASRKQQFIEQSRKAVHYDALEGCIKVYQSYILNKDNFLERYDTEITGITEAQFHQLKKHLRRAQAQGGKSRPFSEPCLPHCLLSEPLFHRYRQFLFVRSAVQVVKKLGERRRIHHVPQVWNRLVIYSERQWFLLKAVF